MSRRRLLACLALGPVAWSVGRARAQAVRDYLVQHHGIQPARLRTVGHGEARPLEGQAPDAPENRRVQFHGS